MSKKKADNNWAIERKRVAVLQTKKFLLLWKNVAKKKEAKPWVFIWPIVL